jgi:hypothetical protein
MLRVDMGWRAVLGTVGQVGEEVTIVVLEPVIEGPLADVLHGLERTDGDQFVCEEDGLAVVRGVRQGLIYLAEQYGDKIGDVHGVPCGGEC